MSIQPDKLLIVDVESTCWEGARPPGQVNEIIEIGLCVFDIESAQPEIQESILVKPEKSSVSEFCTKLTTLTQAQVDTGISFYEACARLRNEYDALNRAWASWGAYDLNMFISQCKDRNVQYPFAEQHINLKTLFADTHKIAKGKVGMAGALGMLNLTLEGTHHRGGDDAWNIGRILAAMMQRYGDDILLDFWM
jgi:inhibitor of KinA sporulation pathway (predicted exonuclease)